MKNVILVLMLIAYFLPVEAQSNKNKWFEKSESFGGFGGFAVNLAPGQYSYIVGEGAIRLNNFYIGGFGYGTNMGTLCSDVSNKEYSIQSGQGGVYFGMISNTLSKWALFTDVHIAFGEIEARSQVAPNLYEEYQVSMTTYTPQIGISFSPIDFVQFRVYGGYSFSQNIQFNDELSLAIDQPVIGIGLYLGAFQ